MGLMQTPSMLVGNNTIPGVEVSPEIMKKIPGILQACRDYGLEFYDTVVEFLTYDEISEVASYGGFPVRYPHWQWGMEYEELSKGYEHGMHRIYEMVINTNPCYIYCLNSNSIVDHVTVIAHATAHNDFFKNNIYFKPTSRTDQNMMNELANHGTRIKQYQSEWGKEVVQKFIDKCISIETLIDPADAWHKRQMREPIITKKREYHFPRRLKVEVDHNYMEEWINTPEWFAKEKERIQKEEIEQTIGIFKDETRNIFKFIKDYAPLQRWQQDIISMLYTEAMYFAPQRQTKTINEGWASFCDTQIMARWGFAEGGEIFDYALHKAGVLGGKRSMNPYKVGYSLFCEIEERWNKGRFGREYDECEDIQKKKNWDQKLGLGHDKVFEVRQFYDDVLLINDYFDQDFCDKYQFYHWELKPNGEYVIVNRNADQIRKLLMRSKLNGGLPEIKLVDHNHKGKRIMMLEHTWDGRMLHPAYTKDTLKSLSYLWQGPVHLASRDKDGKEMVYSCEEGKCEVVYR